VQYVLSLLFPLYNLQLPVLFAGQAGLHLKRPLKLPDPHEYSKGSLIIFFLNSLTVFHEDQHIVSQSFKCVERERGKERESNFDRQHSKA